MDAINGENGSEEFVHYKDDFSFLQERSPRSPLSHQSRRSDSDSLDLAIDVAVGTSIDQLYNNVYEMQSSDQSPSASYLSYGEESRIDSELCHLAGEYGDLEISKEVVENKEENVVAAVDDLIPKKDDAKKASKTNKSQLSSKNQATTKRSPKNKSSNDAGTDNSELGLFLLKKVRGMLSTGKNPRKTLELALRARNSLEKSANGKAGLEMVMCLHVLAALYCNLQQYNEAIPVLERSIEIPVIEDGPTHALAKFVGCMQLGDTYAMVGKIENSILCYISGLEIQKQFLGPTDPRVGETCRYVAEAHIQALQFDEAQKLCQMALDIHRENGMASFVEEAAHRRLMGLIFELKGEHEAALEHYVLASMAMAAHGHDLDVAAVDCSIGDAYLALARFDEAVFAYKKAVKVFKSAKGENHPAVATVLVRLADLYNKIGQFKESKSFCENALRIYGKPNPGIPAEEIAGGLIDIAAIYQSVNETDRALKLLNKALRIYDAAPGQQSTIAGIEAQIGVMYYMMGNYDESYNIFKNAVSKFRGNGEKKSAWFGIALNQMGLACVQKHAVNEAADLFEEAKCILEKEYGPYHPETLGVYTNLAATYDAMGRLDDAIEILAFVTGMREEKLGTANPDAYDEKMRLAELLKEAGRARSKRSRSFVKLLDSNTQHIKDDINVNGPL